MGFRHASCYGVPLRLISTKFVTDSLTWLANKVGWARMPKVLCDYMPMRLHEKEFREGLEWVAKKLEGWKVYLNLVCETYQDENKKEGSVSEPAQLPSKEVLTEKTEKAHIKVEKESMKVKKADTEVKALKPAVAAAKQ